MALVKRKGGRRRKSIVGRIIRGIVLSVFILLLTMGLVGIVIYKSGEIALRASASTETPHMKVDEEEVKKIREGLEYNNSIAWQDDWITYEGKVYEYREDTLNFLLMGIDHGGKLSSETQLSDWNAGQADTIFLVSLNQEDKTISVIGVPRNAMVDVEVFNSEEERIDTIYDQISLQYPYAGGGVLGLAKMKESVSALFADLPIHGACAVSFDAVSVVTDRLGGIEVVVPDDMTEFKSSYTIGSSQTLTGKTVVDYLRYRDYYALGGATVRLTRQKEFMKTAAERIMSEIKANPTFVNDIYGAVKPYMNTDITLDKAVYIGTKAIECRLSEQLFYQLPGKDEAEYIDGTEDFYNNYILDEDELERIMIEVFYKEVDVTG